MTIHCLECKYDYDTNEIYLQPETGNVVCPRCKSGLTKVINPADFVPIPLKLDSCEGNGDNDD